MARRLTGRFLQRKSDGKWEYTLVVTSREEMGFETTEEYIWRRQNTVVQCIDTQSILDLCEGRERTPGSRVGIRWWEKADIKLAVAR